MLTTVDRIWNRAALGEESEKARPGDVALASLLLAHGMIMNGGMLHVYEVLGGDELKAAIAGYRYFSFDEAARLIEKFQPLAARMDADDASDSEVERIGEIFDRADEIYFEAVPDDSALVARFEHAYQVNPEDFADV